MTDSEFLKIVFELWLVYCDSMINSPDFAVISCSLAENTFQNVMLRTVDKVSDIEVNLSSVVILKKY